MSEDQVERRGLNVNGSVCVTRSGSKIPNLLIPTIQYLWHLFEVFVSVEGDRDDDPVSIPFQPENLFKEVSY